jgi:hypothetical protein
MVFLEEQPAGKFQILLTLLLANPKFGGYFLIGTRIRSWRCLLDSGRLAGMNRSHPQRSKSRPSMTGICTDLEAPQTIPNCDWLDGRPGARRVTLAIRGLRIECQWTATKVFCLARCVGASCATCAIWPMLVTWVKVLRSAALRKRLAVVTLCPAFWDRCQLDPHAGWGAHIQFRRQFFRVHSKSG